jgi:hypothetical protein
MQFCATQIPDTIIWLVIAVRLQDEEFFTVNLSRYASEMKVKM